MLNNSVQTFVLKKKKTIYRPFIWAATGFRKQELEWSLFLKCVQEINTNKNSALVNEKILEIRDQILCVSRTAYNFKKYGSSKICTPNTHLQWMT